MSNLSTAIKSKKKPAAKKHWIQGAIKHPGALSKQAKKAGESPMSFARSHEDAKGTTGKRARLAVTLYNMNH